MDTAPVGARIVHPLGVVPETAVDCLQLAGVLEPFVLESTSLSIELFSLLVLSEVMRAWNSVRRLGEGEGQAGAGLGAGPKESGACAD